jgi:hypothetical protein
MIAPHGDQKGFLSPCDCGNRNPFGYHLTVMVTKINCHQMTNYKFGHYQWIGPNFDLHLKTIKWPSNIFWLCDDDDQFSKEI